MGNRLRKRRKKTKGLGGPGRLDDNMIDKLQNYYGIAIRKPYHDHCDESWCKYLQDDKNKTNTYVRGPGFPKERVKEVRETLEELTNDEL